MSEQKAKQQNREQKKVEGDRWLYEEGQAYWQDCDYKNTDQERGQMMIEASASSGYPMAVAYCHLMGWNGLEKDEKKAFEMFLKIEKETNGDHWAQLMLGWCYRNGYGTDQDDNKGVEFYTKSAEQGNSLAMISLGACYVFGRMRSK